MLQNVLNVCESREAPAPAKYQRGFEQCAILVPAFRKEMKREWERYNEKHKRADESTVAHAAAAFAKSDPIDWAKFNKEAAQAAASAAHGDSK